MHVSYILLIKYFYPLSTKYFDSNRIGRPLWQLSNIKIFCACFFVMRFMNRVVSLNHSMNSSTEKLDIIWILCIYVLKIFYNNNGAFLNHKFVIKITNMPPPIFLHWKDYIQTDTELNINGPNLSVSGKFQSFCINIKYLFILFVQLGLDNGYIF